MTTASEADITARIIDNGVVSGQQLLVIGLCTLLNMLDGFDITAMAIVANSVATQLQLSPDRLGWIFSFALLGMMCGAMFISPLADLIGRRRVILLSIVVIGTSIIATAYATTLSHFISLRFVSGLGAGALLACQASLAAEYSPTKYRALAVAVVTSGYPLGAMMTSVVAAFVMPDYGWRGMFLFGGLVTLTMGFAAFLLLPESLKFLLHRRPKHALQHVNAILEKLGRPALSELPPSARLAHGETQRGYGVLRKLLGSEHRHLTLILWLTFFLCFASIYFLMSWVPKLLEDAGYDVAIGRKAFFFLNLGGVVGTFSMGLLSIRWPLTTVISFMLLAAAIGMVMFASLPGSMTILLSLIFVVGLLQQGGFAGLYSVAAKAYPTQIRTTGIGWSIGLGRSGAVVGPALAGYTIAAGMDISTNFYLFAAPMAIAAVSAYVLRVR